MRRRRDGKFEEEKVWHVCEEEILKSNPTEKLEKQWRKEDRKDCGAYNTILLLGLDFLGFLYDRTQLRKKKKDRFCRRNSGCIDHESKSCVLRRILHPHRRLYYDTLHMPLEPFFLVKKSFPPRIPLSRIIRIGPP